jgi:hypothetical protein
MGGTFAGAGTECPTSGACVSANLTAFRPQHGAAYFPFARTSVPEAMETSIALGPGIRINAPPGDADPAGEDDLIEITINVQPAGGAFRLRRDHTALRIWTTRNKSAGTLIPFSAGQTEPLPFAPFGATLTVWAEWAQVVHGTVSLSIEPATGGPALDTLVFHTFHSIVLALGGEGQVPSLPVDPGSGTFVVGTSLYEQGYDAFLYDEDHVIASGTGAVYNETVTAIMHRGVIEVAVFGYSHGGGSTHSLCSRLEIDGPGIGAFTIVYTGYADGVRNNSDIDTAMELRRPPLTGFHVNHYQHGTLVEDFFLDGGPVPNSNPSPTGLDVETTPWGENSTHFIVDDYFEVRNYMEVNFLPRVTR